MTVMNIQHYVRLTEQITDTRQLNNRTTEATKSNTNDSPQSTGQKVVINNKNTAITSWVEIATEQTVPHDVAKHHAK